MTTSDLINEYIYTYKVTPNEHFVEPVVPDNEQFTEPVVPDNAPEIARAAPDAGRTGARERRKPNWMKDFVME